MPITSSRSRTHPFVYPFDRAAADRRNEAELQAAYASDAARTMLLIDMHAWVDKSVEGQRPLRWLTHEEITAYELERVTPTFLGRDSAGAPRFMLALSEHRARAIPAEPGTFSAVSELRSLAMTKSMDPGEIAVVGLARSLAHWQAKQRCCGVCGGHNELKDGGWRLKCWACGQNHHPRYEPCVIMLVHDGADHCLLGHEHRFVDQMYSTLAGFIEPGEDIEEAVAREVSEEVGVAVRDVQYAFSQPWPFPYSMMVGCHCTADRDAPLTLDPEEIVDARWFHRDEVRRMLAGEHEDGLTVPAPFSLAHGLIEQFVDGES